MYLEIEQTKQYKTMNFFNNVIENIFSKQFCQVFFLQ